MSGGFFRGTSADQDTRFSNKQAKLMKSQKFAPELDHLVDMSKVKMDVVKPWIATRVTEFLGFEDEVLINFIYGLLDGKEINGKEVQIQITGFMEKNTGKFMKELWNLLLSAQKNASGVPQQFLDAKEEEIRKKKAETDLITQEIQRKKEIEHEKQKKMDEEFTSKAVDDASEPVSKYSTAQPDDDKVSGGRSGSRRKNRSTRSPRSSERPASPRRITHSGSISKSFSNSRSYSEDSHKSRSRSISPQSRGRSVSPDRRHLSPRKRLSPRRKYSPRRPRSPLRWRSPHSRRISPSYSRRRSPPPRRRRSPSPMVRSSPSLRRRRSPTMRRRRSPTPVRRRSPSPARRRSSPPMRRRSPTLRHKSPSIVRSRSPLATHRRSPTASPPPRHRSSSSPARRKSPSSPARRGSPSPPARRRSPSPPARRRSPSPPARRRSPSPPARRRSPSPPARRRSPSPPARRRSPSPPARRRSPSSPLTRRRSPSPVRRRSPRQRRRSPLRPPTRKYRGGSPYRRRSPAYQRRRSLSRDRDDRNNGAGSRRYQDDYRPERTGGRKSPLIPGEGKVENSGANSASRHPPISLRSPQRDQTDQSDTGRIVPAPQSFREVSPSHSGSSMHSGKSSASEEQRNMATYASSASPVRQTSLDDSRKTARESQTHLSRVDAGHRTSPQRRVGHSLKEGSHRSITTKDSKDEEYSPERPSAHQLGDDERSVDDIEVKRKERDNRSEKASLRIDSLTPSNTAPTPQPAEYSTGRVEVKEFTSVNAGDEHKSFPRDDNDVDEKSHSHLRDVVGSGIDSEDERKSKSLERKKHKRHDRRHTASEDDSGYDSHIDERKDAKRRRKEEKKLRKEEKRRRREERHRKKEERRAGKLKAKAVDTDKNMSDADDSDDHIAVTGERETEQKKLEIELRKKALESLRAKKAINPSDI